MLSLYILSEKEPIQSRDGKKFEAQKVFYRANDELITLQTEDAPLPSLDDVEILLQIFGGWFIKLSISKNRDLKQAIQNYMIFKHHVCDNDFNCRSFVSWYAGVGEHDGSQLLNHWEFKPCNKWMLRPGEIVMFLANEGRDHFLFRHAAIYLGFNRYLSVWGGGQLKVTTLESMMECYETRLVYVANPK